MAHRVQVGCCGWPLPQARYFERFPVTEVQSTFYEPPRIATLRRWRERAPREFEFTLKAWQLITHEPASPTYRRLRRPIAADRSERYGAFKPTEEVRKAWCATLECARTLAASVVVFQCPASFAPTDDHIANLRAFFERAHGDVPDLVFAWEPRGAWSDALVAQLCGELRLVHVVDPILRRPAGQDTRYFRLHGVTSLRHSYSDAELEQLADAWQGRGYVMFNNVPMAEDAERFLRLIAVKRN